MVDLGLRDPKPKKTSFDFQVSYFGNRFQRAEAGLSLRKSRTDFHESSLRSLATPTRSERKFYGVFGSRRYGSRKKCGNPIDRGN